MVGWGREQLPWEGTDKLGSRRNRGHLGREIRSGSGGRCSVWLEPRRQGGRSEVDNRQNSQILGPYGGLVRVFAGAGVG